MKKIFSVLLLSFFYFALTAQHKTLVDSLEKQLPSLTGKDKFIALSDISFYAGYYDIKKSGETAREAMKLSFSLKDSSLFSEGLNGMAIYYYRIGELDTALDFNYNSLAIRRSLGDIRGQAASLSKIGMIYVEQANYEGAIDAYHKAYLLFEQTGDAQTTAMSLNNISSVHRALGNYEKVKYYAALSIKKYEGTSDEWGVAAPMGNMGIYYQNTGQQDSSIYWMNRTLDIYLKSESYLDAAIAENNLGVSYRSKGNSQEGLRHYLNAYNYSERIGDRAGMAQYGANAGGVHNDLGQYERAEKYFQDALEYARSYKALKIIAQCYDGLATASFAQGKLKDALKYKDENIKFRDSVLNLEKIKQLAEAEIKFQTARKEKEALEAKAKLAIEKEERALVQSKAESRRKWVIGIILSSVIFILLLSIYFIRKRQKERLVYDAEIIRQRDMGLKFVIYATEEERKRIARELHDGIGQQLGGLKLSLQNFGNEFAKENNAQKNKLIELSRILDAAAVEVRSISHQMMPKVLSEVGLAPAIEDMLKKTFGNAGIHYEFETFGLNGRYAGEVEITMYRISQELVNNILKHAGATNVTVQLFKNKNQLILMVEDNGKGFDFTIKKDGIGMLNITSRLNTVNGEAHYEADPEKGTIATIRVPV